MITLNQSDIRFMQAALPLSEGLRELFAKLVSAKNKKLIPDEISSELSNLCEERLATHGFDDYNSPTEEGRKLEELIDKLDTE
ncbi:MAG: hypothetical protein E4H07_06955 [Nitrosomonadales bacterium]|jgi:hypothetical protein|nr:MAG: hypothetical protein E4H07_06955 [Nitrosomonadales bacterium]